MKRLIIFILCFSSGISFAQQVTKKHGREKVVYRNGTASGKVKHGKKQGMWTYHDSNGVVYMIKEFRDDKENGLCTEYYPDHHIASQGRYANGMKEGTWESYYQDGKKQSRAVFLHDTLNGEYFEWYNNGVMAIHADRFHGKYIYNWTWNTDGKPLEFQYFVNGLKSGTWRSYPFRPVEGDTSASVVAEYALGELNGKWQRFSGNHLVDEATFRNGKLNGARRKFNADGTLLSEEEYMGGLANGKACTYNNGKLTRKAIWVNGTRTGPEDEWDIYGRKLSHAYYTRNDIDTMITYYPVGKIASSRVYRRESGIAGMIEYSDYVVYDTSDAKIQTGKYRSNTKIDQWNTYYPNGKVWSETHYKNGVLDGLYKRWYQNGKPMIEVMMLDGSMLDGAKVWNDKGVLQKKGSPVYNEILEGNLPGEIYMEHANNEMDHVYDPDNEIPVQTVSEVQPAFPGGEPAMRNFINKNLRYPSNNSLVRKEQVVQLSFYVEPDGTISSIVVKRGVEGAPEFGHEAERVIASMPKWSPGERDGKHVRMEVILSVKFNAESAGN